MKIIEIYSSVLVIQFNGLVYTWCHLTFASSLSNSYKDWTYHRWLPKVWVCDPLDVQFNNYICI